MLSNRLTNIKRRRRGGKRTRTTQAREALNKALIAKEAILDELYQTESLQEYDDLIIMLNEVIKIEDKAKETLKTYLRKNK